MAQVKFSAVPALSRVTWEATLPAPQANLGGGWVGALHLWKICPETPAAPLLQWHSNEELGERAAEMP